MVISQTLSHYKVSDMLCDPFLTLELPADWFQGATDVERTRSRDLWHDMFMRPDRRVSFCRAMLWLAEKKPVEQPRGPVALRPLWTEQYTIVCHGFYVTE